MARSQKVQVDIVADASSYAAGIRKAIGDTDKFNKATKRAGKQNAFGGIAKNAMRAAAAIGGMYAVYDQGKKAVNTTTDLAKSTIQLTRTTGLSTREASRFIAITKVRGIETQKLTTSFTILSKQIVAASEGGAKAADAFAKLGVSQDAIRRGDTQQVFLEAADGLSKMENGARKTALAAQLFGRGYQALFPILDLGAKGIQEQLRLAGLLGAEIGEKGVTSYKEYASAQRTAMLAVMGLRVQLGTLLLQAFAAVATAVAKFVIDFRTGAGAAGSLRDKLQSLLNIIITLYSPLTQTRNAFANVAAAVVSIGTAVAAVKLGATLGGIGTSLAAIFSNPYTAGAFAIAAAIAAIAAAFYLAYKKSKEFRAAVDDIYKAVKPALSQVGATARRELPKMAKAAAQVAKATAQVLTELKPIIVPVIKAMALSIRAQLQTVGPVLRFLAGMARVLAGAISAAKGVISTAMRGISRSADAVKGVVTTAFSAMRTAANGAASAIRSVLSLLQQTPAGKLLEVIKRLTGTRMSAMSAVQAFGLGAEIDLANAQRDLALAEGMREKTKAQRRRKRDAVNSAQARVNAAELRQAIQDAGRSIRDVFSSIIDKIKEARLAQIMAPINERRDARAAATYARTRSSLEQRIRDAEAEQSNPAAQERYARRRASLEARLLAARQRGDLELVDSLQGELDALNARYGPEYLANLRDELSQLNDDETERTADRAAETFAESFRAGLEQAFANLAGSPGVQGFFDAIRNALSGSGLSNGDLSSLLSGTGTSASTISGANLTSAIRNFFQGKKKGTYNASAIAKAIGQGVTKDQVYGARGAAPRGYAIRNRASGGMLSRTGLTLVGETGPELVSGGNVMSATRTARTNGAGVTLNVYPQTTADDPVALARALGWQLATR